MTTLENLTVVVIVALMGIIYLLTRVIDRLTLIGVILNSRTHDTRN